MADNRRTQLRVAYNPDWEEQSDFGVPLASGDMSAVLPLKEGTQSHIEPVFGTEDLNDCTTQYLIDYIIRTRLARLTLNLEVDKDILAGLIKYALGVQSGSNIRMLSPTTYILPATSFVVGFADGEDPGILLSDAVCESLRITGEINQKFDVQAVFVGRGDMPDADHVFGECITIVPLRFDDNAEFFWGATDFIQDTRRIVFNHLNNLPLADFPFSLGSIDIARPLQRGDKRTTTFDWVVTGRPNDTLGREAMAAPNPTHKEMSMRIGNPGLQFIASDAMIRPASGAFQVWEGEVALACLATQVTPTKVPGDLDTPLLVVVD
jgi:hypothetical protein